MQQLGELSEATEKDTNAFNEKNLLSTNNFLDSLGGRKYK